MWEELGPYIKEGVGGSEKQSLNKLSKEPVQVDKLELVGRSWKRVWLLPSGATEGSSWRVLRKLLSLG